MLLKNIARLYGTYPGTDLQKGNQMQTIPVMEQAWLYSENGRIQQFGPMHEQPDFNLSGLEVVDCEGVSVLPGFVDVHTHLVFARHRAHEFQKRLKGWSYQQIAQEGGGILNSAKYIKQASESELFQSAWERLQEVIASGTCAIEIKSGYGLEWEQELKMLGVIQRLKEQSPIPVKATYLAAHAVPAGWQTEAYVDFVVKTCLPELARLKLADYVDVFCETGYFNVEQCRKILTTAQSFGFSARLHAEQLSHTGGIALGTDIKARSVDHLEFANQEDIQKLKQSKVFPVILPGAAFFLQLPAPPVRDMLQAGLPLVIGSDYNPGSSPSGNMLDMMRLACITMGFQIEEAFFASTQNAACLLNLEKDYGSIWPGKKMHLILSKPGWDLTRMVYEFSSNPIQKILY